ncbi:MAG: hypothetical protein WAK55_03880 [Xanthobacteraceae bacterium]
MTILGAFISEGEARGNHCSSVAEASWETFVELFRHIDASREPHIVQLRAAMEQIAKQTSVPYPERAVAMIPLLRPFMPEGGTLH